MTNISYLLYADTDNPNGYPDTWVADSIIDADPVPEAPWITATDTEFAVLIAQQREEFSELQAGSVEQKRRDVLVLDAWTKAWIHVNIWFDLGGLIRCNSWERDPNANAAGKAFITAVRAWIDALMGVYLFVYKPTLLAGGSVNVDFQTAVGDSPYTFTQILVACNTPWFTSQPSNATVLRGLGATFSVVTGGYDNRTYQWQRSNDAGVTWNNITDATTADYTVSTVIGDSGAKFRCECQTSAVTVAISNSVSLTVL